MRHTTLTFSITTLLALAACGGSSSSNPGTGTTAAKVSQGAITARSSSAITVNGTPFATTGATVVVDDNPKPESELKVGMIVKVKIDDKGKAFEFDSKSDLRGLVTAKSGTTVSVGGQVVRVDDSTEFEDNVNRLGGVSAGTRIKVHGFPDDQGGLRATRIDGDASSNDFEIHGFASGLSTGGFTLKISKDSVTIWTVNYASGVSAPAGLVEGSFVEVKALTPPTGNVISASAVKLDDDKLGEAQVEAEIEGVVTSGDSTSFVIDGHTVTTSASTVWENGVPADLVTGVKVEAEGTLDASGNLVAKKVSFRDTVRLQGAVGAVNVAGNSFTLLGRKVTVSDSTEYKSGSGGGAAPSLGSLIPGTTLLQIRGSLARNGTDVVAIRVESTNDSRIFVQGPVSTAGDATARTIGVLGFTVDLSTVSSFQNKDGSAMALADFVAAAKVGTIVKARAVRNSTPTPTGFQAEEIEIDGDR